MLTFGLGILRHSPFNPGMTHKFCRVLVDLISSNQLSHSAICFYTSSREADLTNAMYLLGAFLVLHLDATPEEASAPFEGLETRVLPYRDATWVPSTWDLHLVDCWRGLRRAVLTGLYDTVTFNEDEYFYYDQPCHGDMHEVVKAKFFAFKGPTDVRKPLGGGAWSKTPLDYIDAFRSKGISIVIRLNNPECKSHVS